MVKMLFKVSLSNTVWPSLNQFIAMELLVAVAVAAVKHTWTIQTIIMMCMMKLMLTMMWMMMMVKKISSNMSPCMTDDDTHCSKYSNVCHHVDRT